MSGTFLHKPELALRRAVELESIRQTKAALELLHEVLSSRRQRTWSPTYEQIMITYLNLCLKTFKSREAKDGLHQYRNLSQTQAPGSLEKVIIYLMDQAERKCEEAKKLSDAKIELEDSGDDEGLGTASPQAVLLSTMSSDPNKYQRDSTHLLPSIKFLWETYRAVLDILKSNSKLEHVYHIAAVGALKFCRVYKRRTEFRRLCEMLRLHLGNLQKYGNTQQAGEDAKPSNKVRGWEGWSTDSIELHLQTRFAQLETASVLHLYTEGFRTVEDIYNILQISQSRRKNNPSLPPVRAKLMAAYYEKLTTLFWVSENYLFHAYAWYKYYTLCKEFNRAMSDTMKKMQASAVLMATLCIPVSVSASGKPDQQHGITSTLDDDIFKEKMARMATLLGFHTRHPTREGLLTEINSKNIMEDVPEYLQQLYSLLEENSDPLKMVEATKPLLEKLAQEVGATTSTESEVNNDDVADNTLGRYVKPLTSVLLLKLLIKLSAAYHTVSLDHLKKLTGGLDLTFDQVEKAIVLFSQNKSLSVRIDHRAGCLRFGNPELESESMRSQLTELAKQLESVCNLINPPDLSSQQAAKAVIFEGVRKQLPSEHAAILERKEIIEKRKEEVERLAQDKIKADAARKAEEAAARKAEEEQRLEREKRVREKEKQKKIKREMEAMEKKKILIAMGRDTEQITEEELAKVDTDKLAKEHAEKANKKKDEAERKTREVAKRLDYLVRAVRIEELPLIKKKYEEKVKADRERYESDLVDKRKKAEAQWESDVKEKTQLDNHNVFAYLEEFEGKIMAGRELKHKELCKEEDERAEMVAEKGKVARARKRKLEAEKRKAEEEQRRKEEAEKARIAEEKARKEAEKRKKEEEEAKRRREEDARMQERERKAQERRAPPGGGGGGGDRYVPPSMRNRGGGGGGGSSGSGYNDRDRGGGYGGGRYDRDRGNDRWGDRRDGGGFSRRDRDDGYGRRDDGGGGFGRRNDDRYGRNRDDRRGDDRRGDDRRGDYPRRNRDDDRGGYGRRDDRRDGGGRRW